MPCPTCLSVCVCRFFHNRHATTRAATFTGDVDTGATFYSTAGFTMCYLLFRRVPTPGRGRRLSHRVAHVRCDHGRSAALLAAACRSPQQAVVLPSPSDGVGGEEVKSGAGVTLPQPYRAQRANSADTVPRRAGRCRSCTCDQTPLPLRSKLVRPIPRAALVRVIRRSLRRLVATRAAVASRLSSSLLS